MRIAGIWQGALTLPAGARLRLVVKIREEAGALIGTMDSVDQGARDMPIDSIQFENGHLLFTMRAIGGRYEGELAESGDELVGTWSQGGGNLPLTLRRDSNVPVIARPQEPSRPLPSEGVRPAASAQMESQVQQMSSAWMRWMLAYDPLPALRQLEIPVLALSGERDLQVPPKQSKPPLESALLAGHPASRVVELPRLNHLFQAAATGAPAEYAAIEETMNVEALELIAEWIIGQAVAAR